MSALVFVGVAPVLLSALRSAHITTVASSNEAMFSNGFSFPHVAPTSNGESRVIFSGYHATSEEIVGASGGKLTSIVTATEAAQQGFTALGSPSSTATSIAFLGVNESGSAICMLPGLKPQLSD